MGCKLEMNPGNPAESVIERGLPWRAYSWTGLGFLAAGAFVLLWGRPGRLAPESFRNRSRG